MSAPSESETRCPMCENVIREDDLYEDGCPFCGTWVEVVDEEGWEEWFAGVRL